MKFKSRTQRTPPPTASKVTQKALSKKQKPKQNFKNKRVASSSTESHPQPACFANSLPSTNSSNDSVSTSHADLPSQPNRIRSTCQKRKQRSQKYAFWKEWEKKQQALQLQRQRHRIEGPAFSQLSDLHQALDCLTQSNLSKNSVTQPIKPCSNTNQKYKKRAVRQESLKLFQATLEHPQFKKHPLKAIQTHLQLTLQANQKQDVTSS